MPHLRICSSSFWLPPHYADPTLLRSLWKKRRQPGPPLAVSKALILTPKGGRNPTVAVDRRSGAVYLAWAQEVLGPAAKQGKKADPVLQVLVARSDDGGLHSGHGKVSLASLCGQVILLNTWATWCSPCRQEILAFETLYRQYRDQGPNDADHRRRHLLSESTGVRRHSVTLRMHCRGKQYDSTIFLSPLSNLALDRQFQACDYHLFPRLFHRY